MANLAAILATGAKLINVLLQMMNVLLKNDECCIQNDECCIENDECCIEMMTSLLNPGQGIENTHAAKLAARYEVRVQTASFLLQNPSSFLMKDSSLLSGLPLGGARGGRWTHESGGKVKSLALDMKPFFP